MLQVFDVDAPNEPAAPNRTAGGKPYKDLAGVRYIVSDGQIMLAEMVIDMPYRYGIVTANTATTILVNGYPARFLVGVQNLSTAAQSVTLTIYDNASAASGTVVAALPALAAGQVVTFPSPGIPLANGATALASGAPGGSGIMIMAR